MQSVNLEPDQGAIIDLIFPEPGTYPFVDHAFNHAAKGAAGAFNATTNFTEITSGTGQGLNIIPFKPPYTVISWASQTITTTTSQLQAPSFNAFEIISTTSIILSLIAMIIVIKFRKK
ncbi:MAG: hypothetical protein ACP5GU_07670 [Thermoprotei archaeon]